MELRLPHGLLPLVRPQRGQLRSGCRRLGGQRVLHLLLAAVHTRMPMIEYAVLGGFGWTCLFGDPAWLPPPGDYYYMGKAISALEKRLPG